jgi:AcrR family transcriptional regulator
MDSVKSQISSREFSEIEQKILESYLSLCARHGITQVTIQMIAKQAKLAFATVRYHFSEKEIDFDQAASLFVARSGQRFTADFIERARSKKGFNPVKAYLDGTFEWFSNNPDHANFLLYFYYASGTHKGLWFRNGELLETARLRTLSFVNEAVGMGTMAKPKDAGLLAFEVHSIVFGSGVMAMSVNNKAETGRIQSTAWRMIQKIWR